MGKDLKMEGNRREEWGKGSKKESSCETYMHMMDVLLMYHKCTLIDRGRIKFPFISPTIGI